MISFGIVSSQRASLQGAFVLLAACLGSAIWVGPARAADPGFTEVTEQAGLVSYHNSLTDTPGYLMLGGGTVGDFNGDGWPDLFHIDGGQGPDRLFINQKDGTFVDRAAAWGLTERYRGSGAAAGDYDRDGDVDLMVTSFGDMPGSPAPGHHRLYRNDGGRFTNVAAEAGVNSTNPDIPDGFSPSWGDYDLDGDLDLWIGGWFEGQSPSAAPELVWKGTRLFRNEGDGTFVDVSEETGVFDPKVRGFSAIFADMDGDRYPELLVAADFNTSRYFRNNRDGTFTNVGFTGWEAVDNGMGTALGDFDRDGRQDWFVTSIYPGYHYLGPPGNRLYRNLGNHELAMIPESAGVNDGDWGWGATAIDFDHDGWVDLYHTDGFQGPDVITREYFINDPSHLFRNNADGTFTDVAIAMGIEDRGQGRMAGVLDYDRDGDLDIINLSCGEPSSRRREISDLRLFRNDLSGDDAHWLEIRLSGGDNPRITPDARGTSVRIRASDGTTQVAQLTGHANYLGGNELLVHFGLGAATGLRQVSIDWSDGFSTVLRDVAADQRLDLAASKPYRHGPLVRGAQADLVVSGLRRGERAFFLAGIEGGGRGPCPPGLGGHLCSDVVNPRLLGEADADGAGVATLTITVPDPPGATKLTSQVMVRRGPGGAHSLKSNVVTAPLLDAVARAKMP